MRRAAAVAALVLCAATACTSCTSSGPSTGQTPTVRRTSATPPAGSVGPAGTTALPSGTPVPAAALQRILTRGVSSIRSAHVELSVSLGGATVTSSGDETLRDGVLTSIALRSTLPSGDAFEVRVVGGRTYAMLPRSLYRTTRQWVLISTSSPAAKIRALATSIGTSLRSASLTMVSQYLSAASSVRRVADGASGPDSTTGYGLLVSVAMLPATFPGRASLIGLGVRTVPVQLFLDAAGRPVRVSEVVTLAGQTTSVVASLTKVNVPVTVSAPPAAQVGTS